MRRALVTLPDGVWKVLDKELKGKIGDGDSEVIRNIVMAHLIEKGYLFKTKEMDVPGLSTASREQINEIAGELNIVDTQVEALTELLEETGVLNYSAFENRVKKKLAEEKEEIKKGK